MKKSEKVNLEVSVDEDFNNTMNGVEAVETANELKVKEKREIVRKKFY